MSVQPMGGGRTRAGPDCPRRRIDRLPDERHGPPPWLGWGLLLSAILWGLIALAVMAVI